MNNLILRNSNSEFDDLFFKLIPLLKIKLKVEVVNTVGLFKWELNTNSTRRRKKTYSISKSMNYDESSDISSLSWFLYYDECNLELIQDYKMKNCGEVIWFKFKRKGHELTSMKKTLLRIR